METLNLDELSEIVGGRIRLVSLMQKRLRELGQGMRPLVESVEGLQDFEIVAEEIRQKKIWLVVGEEADKLRKLRRSQAQLPKLRPSNEPPPPPPRK